MLYKQGLSAEDIEQTYDHLSIGQVFAALAYYHANQQEIDAALVEEDALYDLLKKELSKKGE